MLTYKKNLNILVLVILSTKNFPSSFLQKNVNFDNHPGTQESFRRSSEKVLTQLEQKQILRWDAKGKRIVSLTCPQCSVSRPSQPTVSPTGESESVWVSTCLRQVCRMMPKWQVTHFFHTPFRTLRQELQSLRGSEWLDQNDRWGLRSECTKEA